MKNNNKMKKQTENNTIEKILALIIIFGFLVEIIYHIQ